MTTVTIDLLLILLFSIACVAVIVLDVIGDGGSAMCDELHSMRKEST